MQQTTEEVQTVGNVNELPKESFSYDQLKQAWRKFAFQAKANGTDTLYLAMVKREPHLIDDLLIKMEIDNQFQFDYITPLLTDMLAFFRKELNNFHIHIELFVTQNEELELKYKSGKDKFAALAKRNPNLHKMVEILNLEIEY